jgi:hypothetical protein
MAARATVSHITACLIPMGVWCDPVRNQFGENGCDYDLRTGWPGNKRVSLDCCGDENAIATAIQRWLISCLDFGLLMGVAIRLISMSRPEMTRTAHMSIE